MNGNLAGLTALQENVIKTKEHVESVRSALDTAKQNVFQYTTMVSPSADQLNRVVQFVGNTDSTYTHGYFYTCESDGSGGYQWTEIEFGSIGDFLEEVVELPTATASNVGHTYILIAPQTGYKLGGIYQNHSDGETPPTYSWVLISSSNLTSGNAIDIINDQINVKVDDDTIHIDDTSNEAYVDNAIRKQFIGTQAQWDALSSTEQAEYAIVNINDNIDYTGNIDAVPTQNSPNAVSSGGVYSALTDYQKKDLASAVEGASTVEGALGALSSGKVSTDLVPSDASASNKLVTRAQSGAILPLVNLGTEYTAELKADISSGKFEKAVVGGYLTINGHVYYLAHPDYWLHTGDTECTTHHMLVIPADNIGTGNMNDTNITTGAYTGSDMKTGNNANTALATAATQIKADFGAANILTHRELFVTAVTDGKASHWAWADSDIDLMNEVMVYGYNVWASAPGYETGIDNCQIKLFQERHDLITTRAPWWLRSVVSATHFAHVHTDGTAHRYGASGALGVRPAFAIIGD